MHPSLIALMSKLSRSSLKPNFRSNRANSSKKKGSSSDSTGQVDLDFGAWYNSYNNICRRHHPGDGSFFVVRVPFHLSSARFRTSFLAENENINVVVGQEKVVVLFVGFQSGRIRSTNGEINFLSILALKKGRDMDNNSKEGKRRPCPALSSWL